MHRKLCNEFEDVLITKIILRQQKAITIRYHNFSWIPVTERYIVGINGFGVMVLDRNRNHIRGVWIEGLIRQKS